MQNNNTIQEQEIAVSELKTENAILRDALQAIASYEKDIVKNKAKVTWLEAQALCNMAKNALRDTKK